MFEIFCARKVEDKCLNSSLLVFFNGFFCSVEGWTEGMHERAFVVQEVLCSRECTNFEDETSATEILHCVNSYWLREGH